LTASEPRNPAAAAAFPLARVHGVFFFSDLLFGFTIIILQVKIIKLT
jgi:hypothetical protein